MIRENPGLKENLTACAAQDLAGAQYEDWERRDLFRAGRST
jgi:hypothetical protein